MKYGLVTVVALSGASVAHAQGKIPLVPELQKIATKFGPRSSTQIAPVTQGCTAPTSVERADAKKRALAWIDSQHPDETGPTSSGPDDLELQINLGCRDASGIVLDISQDRELKKSKGSINGTRRNYLLRVSSTAVEVIAQDTSTHSLSWMEWADEGRISLLAQVDVDGDGAVDIVYSDHEREGGATNTYDRVQVRFANGKVGSSGQITNLSDVKVIGKQVVVSGMTRQDVELYVCLAPDLRLAPCAAAKSLQTAADRRAIAAQFVALDSSAPPDRDLVAQQLATLGIPSKRRAELVAAAPPTALAVRVQRQVTAFLAKAKLVEPESMSEIVHQAHPESRAYLDDLAMKLGDTACTTSALTADEQTRANAWIRKQDAKARDIAIAPSACGPYMWLGWWPEPNRDGKRRQVLLGRDGTTRILGFLFAPDMDAPSDQGLSHLESWFTHDGTAVGIVIGGENLWVIANGKVVSQTKGTNLAFYRADDRWDETSSSIFLDGGTLWHATPTGRERLDRTLIQDHEVKRAAIALLSLSPASSDAKYIAALQLLGADKALIAAAKKLP